MRVEKMSGVKRRGGDKRVLRCPQCGSRELYYEAGMITGHKYHCKRCHYIGPLVIQDEGD